MTDLEIQQIILKNRYMVNLSFQLIALLTSSFSYPNLLIFYSVLKRND